MLKKLSSLLFAILFSTNAHANEQRFPWEDAIEMDSVYACAGRADPQESYGNDGVMPTFLKFGAMLEWYLPFFNGQDSNYLFYTGSDDDNSHWFQLADGSMQMNVLVYSVETEPTPILSVHYVITDEARAEEVGVLVQRCANVPIEMFD